MKRGQSCWRCEYLGQDYPKYEQTGCSYVEAELMDICQHPTAIAMRDHNQRLLETRYAPHWCPKENSNEA